jgi:hypothetical protein
MTITIRDHSQNGRWCSHVLHTDDDGWTDPPLSLDDPIGEIYGRTEAEAIEYARLFCAAPALLDALKTLVEDCTDSLPANFLDNARKAITIAR